MNGTPLTRSPVRSLYAFVQARTGSSRFPNKVLTELPSDSGTVLLDHVHHRLDQVLPESRIVYLIPEGDSALEDFLSARGRRFFSGSLEDVRARYISAAKTFGADAILRLTGDNPFYDVKHLSLLVFSFLEGGADLSYFSGLPLGTGGEIFRTQALLWEPPEGIKERHREHVSLHIKETPEKFRIRPITAILPPGSSEIVSQLRMTIDTKEDYTALEKLLNGPAKRIGTSADAVFRFGAEELLSWQAEFPEIFQINRDVPQIRFPLPSPVLKSKGRIGLLIAGAKEFGSGHEARSHLLYSLLPQRDWETSLLQELPEDGEFAGLIVDYRDLKMIRSYKKTKVLLLDHFGPERMQYPHWDLLPHPLSGSSFDWENILISPYLTQDGIGQEKESGKSWEIFCYAGALDGDTCNKLDDSLAQRSGSVFRVGGTPPKDKHSKKIGYSRRLSSMEYLETLKKSGNFYGYFGQSLFEAMYLGIPSATFPISPVHKTLSEYLWKEAEIPYGDTDFLPSFSVGTRKPGAKGYDRILEYIDILFQTPIS